MPKRKTPYLPAYEVNRKLPDVRKFLSSYSRLIGHPRISYGLTVADENILSAAKVPVITLGPMGGEAHSSGEWVSKKDFLLLSVKFPAIIQEMLK